MNSLETEKNKKRSRRVLSLKERIEVIKIAETRRDTRQLALKFDCGRTQILSILSQKDRLLKEWANNTDPNRLRRRPSAFGYAINKVMYEWIFRCRCNQIRLSDTAIMEKAYQAKQFFKYSEFRPNRRWLERFKNRFRIHEDELLHADSSISDGAQRSLRISDIYEDLKGTLDPSVNRSVAERHNTMTKMLDQEGDNYSGASLQDSMNDETNSNSNYDICEIVDSDDQGWQPESFCETQMYEENSFAKKEKETTVKSEVVIEDNEPLKNVTQVLECLKKLEEYSMLREDFRAIGLIGQLEMLYKGKLES